MPVPDDLEVHEQNRIYRERFITMPTNWPDAPDALRRNGGPGQWPSIALRARTDPEPRGKVSHSAAENHDGWMNAPMPENQEILTYTAGRDRRRGKSQRIQDLLGKIATGRASGQNVDELTGRTSNEMSLLEHRQGKTVERPSRRSKSSPNTNGNWRT